jgi:flavin reductase (DIM6/NTAB) family NADH-FMN oxidoreductase RutF
MPVALVGAHVDGKPTFLTVAWFTMVSFNPPRIAIALGKGHYTNPGLRKTNLSAFVCLQKKWWPQPIIAESYRAAKPTNRRSSIFFYGELKTAPMITGLRP